MSAPTSHSPPAHSPRPSLGDPDELRHSRPFTMGSFSAVNCSRYCGPCRSKTSPHISFAPAIRRRKPHGPRPFRRVCDCMSLNMEDMSWLVSISARFNRSTVGFDRVFSLLDSFGHDGAVPGYPPYNIERTGENAYRISVAVAGFTDKEIDLEVKENELHHPRREESRREEAGRRSALSGHRGARFRAQVPTR